MVATQLRIYFRGNPEPQHKICDRAILWTAGPSFILPSLCDASVLQSKRENALICPSLRRPEEEIKGKNIEQNFELFCHRMNTFHESLP